jgi:DNA-binding GntR family transcriptional regulator
MRLAIEAGVEQGLRESRATGSARVYGSLREEILRMQLAPASPLDEVGLSERFGLSRSPVREALVRPRARALW